MKHDWIFQKLYVYAYTPQAYDENEISYSYSNRLLHRTVSRSASVLTRRLMRAGWSLSESRKYLRARLRASKKAGRSRGRVLRELGAGLRA